ncbi:MAG: penicillin-binding protein 2 [Anaerolineales bacterium]|nr:penicillin-binding protein 2 [Anaerolineales bacterium]
MIRTQNSIEDHLWRYNVIAIFFVAIGCLIIVQILRTQVSPQADDLRQIGDMYARTLHTYYPPRGQVYDRWGRLLAGNTLVYELGAQVYYVSNPDSIAFALSKVLVGHQEYDRPEYQEEILLSIRRAIESGQAYVQLADFVTPEEMLQLQDWYRQYDALPDAPYGDAPRPSLDGLVYRPRMQRIYPEDDLGANVLGFVNREGQGVFGVEQRFNDLLAGEAEAVWIPLDPYRVDEIPQMTFGADLILTLDREIQAMLEDRLESALNESGAEGGTIIVMDPQTGEILGMAVTPRLNPNAYWDYEKSFPDNQPYNRAVSTEYEPGSVFKVLTMAAALDSDAVEVDTEFIDTGVFQIGGIYIYNWNYGAWGPQNMQGCMQHSLNVCLAWVANTTGAGTFYEYMQAFGIGHLTGVDMAAEAYGRLKLPGDSDWFDADLGTNSFGQGVAVTPVQMLMAVSALANEGQMVMPHVVRSIVNNGHQYDPAPQVVGMPISAETARTMTDMLAASLEDEASDALVEGYSLAGKTGTAEIPGPLGYDSSLTNASFVGWGPVDDVQFLVYIWLEKPTVSPWGSVVAAPVFRQVVEELVVLMDIPPDGVLMGAEVNRP